MAVWPCTREYRQYALNRESNAVASRGSEEMVSNQNGRSRRRLAGHASHGAAGQRSRSSPPSPWSPSATWRSPIRRASRRPASRSTKDPDTAHDYTVKGNLVAVISNGTAVLGLGDIGALAGKPVMEGKAVLFKRFADVDCIDIEVDDQGRRPVRRTACASSGRPSAASTSRTSRRRSASSSSSACAS